MGVAYDVPSRDQSHAAWANRVLAFASPIEILTWAISTFGDEFCITTSLADAVLIDMVCRVQHGTQVLFLDTGYHFPETLKARTDFAARYPIRLISIRPKSTVPQQDAEHGRELFKRDPDLCCQLRKVEPLNDALRGYRAWASGIRRDETSERSNISVVEWDSARSMVKVNPLANWTKADADEYIAANDVLVNPLLEAGYLSVGCAPCTSPVAPGADARSGRWLGLPKSECGLHTV
jgi:phosphoadenosine phosphosulfate reductase